MTGASDNQGRTGNKQSAVRQIHYDCFLSRGAFTTRHTSGVNQLSVRDDHDPACRLDIRQDSEFATRYGYPKTAFKWEPDTDPNIRNAFIDTSRIQTFGNSCTLHNHSFIIFRSIFSAFCAMTPSLSMV